MNVLCHFLVALQHLCSLFNGLSIRQSTARLLNVNKPAILDSAPTEIADDDDDDDDDGDDGIDLPRKRSKKTQVTLTGEHLTESDDSAPKEDSVEETDSDRMLLKLEDQLLAETKAKYYS